MSYNVPPRTCGSLRNRADTLWYRRFLFVCKYASSASFATKIAFIYFILTFIYIYFINKNGNPHKICELPLGGWLYEVPSDRGRAGSTNASSGNVINVMN